MRMRRRLADLLALLFATAATLFGLNWLAWILWTTVGRGVAALSPALVTQMTPPPGQSGGLANAFYGSAVMVLLALLVGTPVGIAGMGRSIAPAKQGIESEDRQRAVMPAHQRDERWREI